MPILPRQHQRQCPQLGCDFASVDACVGKAVLMVCREMRYPRFVGSGEPANDPLAPARGIVNSLRVSLVLWGLIGLALFLVR